jgi:integrase
VPLPGWLIEIIHEHLTRWPNKPNLPIFANEVGAPLRRGLFRARIWRPSLVRAGLLGQVVGGGPYTARWIDADGASHERTYKTHRRAVMEVARNQSGGMRFHDLRHSYATWLVDDGVPINMVQRVLGHEKSSTTLDIYTRRTDNSARILQALTDDHTKDDGEGDSDGGAAGALAPV